MEKKRKPRSKSQVDPSTLGEDCACSLSYGRKDYDDGVYEGYLLNNNRHGRGTMKAKNGFVYFTGLWKDDKANGYGIMKFPRTGDRHEGNYNNGLRDGLGVFLWANGDKYSGYFQ
jgi:hypothetical protein